ncbi:hypothetical protein LP420_05500 [Massilia sp. B-10]|nr:hypothetical protein LP420_05500 [Massilia sp. B-10]
MISASINVFSLDTVSFDVDTGNVTRPFFDSLASELPDYVSDGVSTFETGTGSALDWTMDFTMVARPHLLHRRLVRHLGQVRRLSLDASHTFTATLGQMDNGQFLATTARPGSGRSARPFDPQHQ